MLPSLLEIIQTGKGRNGASTLASTLNLCKVEFNHLLIHTGFILSRAISIGRKKKKNTKTTVLKAVSFAVINYQSYGFDENAL